jgi:hypothetical protein
MGEHQATFGFFEGGARAVARSEPRSPEPIQHHMNSFALLGREPPPLPARVNDLPDSVAQWYALPDGLLLLKEYSNSDSPLPPYEFEPHSFVEKTLATFLHENQGVCWWAFDLKAGDDPPVYVTFNHEPDRWRPCCSRFSTFVYTRLFDYQNWCHPTLSAIEIGPALTPTTLRELRKTCRRHPTTRGWPGDTQYRFSEDDRRFTLGKTEGQTDWRLSATTEASLKLALEKYRRLTA